MKKISAILYRVLLVILLNMFCGTASAQDNASDKALTPQQQTFNAAIAALKSAAEKGPKEIKLGTQAVLKLPEHFYFIPKQESINYLQAIGNQVDEKNFYGLVVSHNIDGFVSIDFKPAGYIKDDEAKSWDTAKLLKNLQSGTEEGNIERHKRGLPEWEVVGWVEEPQYTASTHRLVWCASIRDKGSNDPDDKLTVNYNTYLLGREGYISLNLVTGFSSVKSEKQFAHQLLNAVDFNSSKRYGDFNASTDKVAKYGLAALIGGVVAKKIGILAGLGFFFVKMWKIAALALVGVGSAIKKIFGGRNK